MEAFDTPFIVVGPASDPVFGNAYARWFFPRFPAEIIDDPGPTAAGLIRKTKLGDENDGLVLLAVDPELTLDPRVAPTSGWARRAKLSPRHACVAALAMQGLDNTRIATTQGLTRNTVETYMRTIREAFSISSRNQLRPTALAGPPPRGCA